MLTAKLWLPSCCFYYMVVFYTVISVSETYFLIPTTADTNKFRNQILTNLKARKRDFKTELKREFEEQNRGHQVTSTTKKDDYSTKINSVKFKYVTDNEVDSRDPNENATSITSTVDNSTATVTLLTKSKTGETATLILSSSTINNSLSQMDKSLRSIISKTALKFQPTNPCNQPLELNTGGGTQKFTVWYPSNRVSANAMSCNGNTASLFDTSSDKKDLGPGLNCTIATTEESAFQEETVDENKCPSSEQTKTEQTTTIMCSTVENCNSSPISTAIPSSTNMEKSLLTWSMTTGPPASTEPLLIYNNNATASIKKDGELIQCKVNNTILLSLNSRCSCSLNRNAVSKIPSPSTFIDDSNATVSREFIPSATGCDWDLCQTSSLGPDVSSEQLFSKCKSNNSFVPTNQKHINSTEKEEMSANITTPQKISEKRSTPLRMCSQLKSKNNMKIFTQIHTNIKEDTTPETFLRVGKYIVGNESGIVYEMLTAPNDGLKEEHLREDDEQHNEDKATGKTTKQWKTKQPEKETRFISAWRNDAHKIIAIKKKANHFCTRNPFLCEVKTTTDGMKNKTKKFETTTNFKRSHTKKFKMKKQTTKKNKPSCTCKRKFGKKKYTEINQNTTPDLCYTADKTTSTGYEPFEYYTGSRMSPAVTLIHSEQDGMEEDDYYDDYYEDSDYSTERSANVPTTNNRSKYIKKLPPYSNKSSKQTANHYAQGVALSKSVKRVFSHSSDGITFSSHKTVNKLNIPLSLESVGQKIYRAAASLKTDLQKKRLNLRTVKEKELFAKEGLRNLNMIQRMCKRFERSLKTTKKEKIKLLKKLYRLYETRYVMDTAPEGLNEVLQDIEIRKYNFSNKL